MYGTFYALSDWKLCQGILENVLYVWNPSFSLLSVGVMHIAGNSVLFDECKCLTEKSGTIIAHDQELRDRYIHQAISKGAKPSDQVALIQNMRLWQ